MTLINRTKLDLLISSLMLFTFLATLGYFLAFAKDEGSLGNSPIVNFLGSYLLYLFPGFVVANSFGLEGASPFFISTIVNIIIYSVLAALLLPRKVASMKIYQPFKLIWFAAYFIPTAIVGTFVIFALTN